MRVPNYNAAVGQLKAGTADAWISPAEIGEKMAKEQGGGVVILAAKELSSAPTAYAVAKSNDKLREAVNKALDEVIADGTWTKLVEQYYPGRAVPATFKPGSGTVKFTAPTATPPQPAEMDVWSTLNDTFLDWESMKAVLPEMLKVGLVNTLIFAAASVVLGTVLGMVVAVDGAVPQAVAALAGEGLHRHLPRPAGDPDHPADRPGSVPDHAALVGTRTPTRWASSRCR